MHESPLKGTGWGRPVSPPPLPVAAGTPLLPTLLSQRVQESSFTQPCWLLRHQNPGTPGLFSLPPNKHPLLGTQKTFVVEAHLLPKHMHLEGTQGASKM